MREISVLNRSLMAMILSLSSDLIKPVLPPESMEAEMHETFLKPANSKDLTMTGAPVPPPMVTILISFFDMLEELYKKIKTPPGGGDG